MSQYTQPPVSQSRVCTHRVCPVTQSVPEGTPCTSIVDALPLQPDHRYRPQAQGAPCTVFGAFTEGAASHQTPQSSCIIHDMQRDAHYPPSGCTCPSVPSTAEAMHAPSQAPLTVRGASSQGSSAYEYTDTSTQRSTRPSPPMPSGSSATHDRRVGCHACRSTEHQAAIAADTRCPRRTTCHHSEASPLNRLRTAKMAGSPGWISTAKNGVFCKVLMARLRGQHPAYGSVSCHEEP